MRAAIMQPTYLPWLGYFAMMDQVDVFVFLDSVQFNARSWQQRNRIKTAHGEQMLTVPVSKKGKRDQLISEVCIQTESSFVQDHKKAMQMSYSKAPFFAEYSRAIFSVLERGHTSLCDLNIDLIQAGCDSMGLQCKFLRSSELSCDGAKADLLVSICKAIGATTYLSAPGSRAYIEESTAFQDANIDVVYNDYHHPEYHQLYGEFLPYMAFVDLLFNTGPAAHEVLISGIQSRVVSA
jgi:hypothetical protein